MYFAASRTVSSRSQDVVADGLPLMFNWDMKPHFPFYWQSDPTRFKSFDEDLLTLVERVSKDILEQLLGSLNTQTILFLPSTSDLFTALDGKIFFLVFLFCV